MVPVIDRNNTSLMPCSEKRAMKKILMILIALGVFFSCASVPKKSIKTTDYLIEAVNASSEYEAFLKRVETTRRTEAKSFADKEMRDFIDLTLVRKLGELGVKEEYPSLEKLKEALNRDPLIKDSVLFNILLKVNNILHQLEQKFPIEGNENKEKK